jgi:hypothetical protein
MPDEPAPESRPGERRPTPDHVNKKDRVLLKGRFEDGTFLAEKIEVLEQEKRLEIKGTLQSFMRETPSPSAKGPSSSSSRCSGASDRSLSGFATAFPAR